MRIVLLLAIILLMCAGAAYGQSLNSAQTIGLTSVISELNGNTFTWTIINNTGPTDGNLDWDVLVWSLQPVGLPKPSQVTAPSGWEWVSGGHSKFQIKSSKEKYTSSSAIQPGESLVFQYQVEQSKLWNVNPQNIEFLAHVAAVEPTPTVNGDKLQWTPTTVDGSSTWHDKSSSIPEPGAVLPFLLACSAIASIAKSVRRRR